MLLSWCGLKSCMRGFSVWRNISSTQPWCWTPLPQKLELWARTIKSWISSMFVLFLSGDCFTSIYFIAGFPWGNVPCVGTSEHKRNSKGQSYLHMFACDVKMRIFSVKLMHMQALSIWRCLILRREFCMCQWQFSPFSPHLAAELCSSLWQAWSCCAHPSAAHRSSTSRCVSPRSSSTLTIHTSQRPFSSTITSCPFSSARFGCMTPPLPHAQTRPCCLFNLFLEIDTWLCLLRCGTCCTSCGLCWLTLPPGRLLGALPSMPSPNPLRCPVSLHLF